MTSLQNASAFETISIYVVLLIALLGLAYALILRRQVLKADKGTPKMQEIWSAIRSGAEAYLGRQLKTILPLIAIFTVILFFSVYIVSPSDEALKRFSNNTPDQVKLIIG